MKRNFFSFYFKSIRRFHAVSRFTAFRLLQIYVMNLRRTISIFFLYKINSLVVTSISVYTYIHTNIRLLYEQIRSHYRCDIVTRVPSIGHDLLMLSHDCVDWNVSASCPFWFWFFCRL